MRGKFFPWAENASKIMINYEICVFWTVPAFTLPGNSVKNHAKLTQTASKTDAKWTRKIMHSGLASAKNTPQRLTCQNASKCIHFCGSRCYFAPGKCQKTCKIYTKRVQILRKMSTKKHGFRYRKRKKIHPNVYLFDFSVFFTFWSSFGALLMVLWNFVDVFLVIFQVLDEFRWFWMDLIQNLT